MQLGWIVAAAFAGFLLPFQAAANARLAHGSSMAFAALVSFIVGTTALAAFVLLTKQGSPGWSRLTGVPWWGWIGGIIGAVFVATVCGAAPKVGVATLTAAAIVGQMLAAALMDKFGFMGLVERALTPMRLAGIALLIVGAVLIRKGG